MAIVNDPYNRKEVVDALVDHAWSDKPDHKPAFKRMGIDTKAELRDVVDRGIDGSDTRCFKAQPVQAKNQAVPREIYELPQRSPEGKQMVVALNPSIDPKTGKPHGGTCYVPGPGKDDGTFDNVFKNEATLHRDIGTGHKPQIVQGGRPALRAQEQRQQVSTEIKSTAVAVHEPAKQKPSQEQKAPEKAKEPKKLEFFSDVHKPKPGSIKH